MAAGCARCLHEVWIDAMARTVLLLLLLLPSVAMAQIVGEPTGDVVFRIALEPSAELLDRLAADPMVRELERRPGSWPTFTARAAPGADPERLAARLERLPEVAWAEADRSFSPVLHGAPLDDEFWPQLWHLENTGQNEGGLPGADIHAVPAWAITNGAGIQVAILDSGVDTDHPDLLVTGGVDVVDNDMDPNPEEADDNPGHGTLVAGVAAAVGNNGIGVAGVAWGAEIWAVRHLGAGGTLQDTRDAFVLATDAGVAVLNNSWGMMTEDCGPVPGFDMLDEAIDYARIEGRGGLGATVVFSAGNQGCEYIEYPMLAREGVIVVGSLTDQDRKFGYSSYGHLLDVMAPSGPVGGHARPGMYSTDIVGDAGFNGAGQDNEYSPWMGGTSGAAPVVSGVVALMYAANDRLTEADVRRVLCETAVRVDPAGGEYDASGWSRFYGCGRVDAAAAVSAVVNTAPGAPTLLVPIEGAELHWEDIVLRWEEPADDDGEWLVYDVELVEPGGDDDDCAAADDVELYEELAESLLDLSGQLPLGDYSVTVWAVDAWGRGASAQASFTVVDIEPEPADDDDDDDGSGCTCSAPASAPVAPLLLLLLLPLFCRRH